MTEDELNVEDIERPLVACCPRCESDTKYHFDEEDRQIGVRPVQCGACGYLMKIEVP